MSRFVIGAVWLLAFAACQDPSGQPTRFAGMTMGTTYEVQLGQLPPGVRTETIHSEVHRVLQGVDAAMSTYDADSEISRFNAGPEFAWVPVSPSTFVVIQEALRIHRITQGAFDPTVGPLVELWGFGAAARAERALPANAAVERARRAVGAAGLELRAHPPAIRKDRASLHLDLSAIAKGFAVDEVARRLEARGVYDYLIEVGGELRAAGRNARGETWTVAVERPLDADAAPECTFELRDASVATSGDYRQDFAVDGVRYSHVLDPRTGRPGTSAVTSATVVTDSAMTADAFATALLVLAPDEGLALATREGLAVRLLVRDGDRLLERTTPGFPHLASSGVAR